MLLAGKRVHPEDRPSVSPGSKQVCPAGQRGPFGPHPGQRGQVLECTCGPCIGMAGSPSSGGVQRQGLTNASSRAAAAPRTPCLYGQPPDRAMAALAGASPTRPNGEDGPGKGTQPESVPSSASCSSFRPATGSSVESCAARTSWPLRSSRHAAKVAAAAVGAHGRETSPGPHPGGRGPDHGPAPNIRPSAYSCSAGWTRTSCPGSRNGAGGDTWTARTTASARAAKHAAWDREPGGQGGHRRCGRSHGTTWTTSE
jgi:hypothetical protein